MEKVIIKPGTGLHLSEEIPKISTVKIQLEIFSLNPEKNLFPSLNSPLIVPLHKSLIAKTLENQILTMKLNETAELTSKFSLFFENDQTFPGETEIKLRISILEAFSEKSDKNPWDLDDETSRYQKANELKTKGNDLLKKQSFKEANSLYSVGLNIIELETGRKFEDVRLFLSSNLILGSLKAGDAKIAKELAEKVLLEDPKLVKVRYRKALAEINLEEFEEAKEDLLKARELEPENKEILQELAGLKEKERKMKEKAKEIYGKMFGGK